MDFIAITTAAIAIAFDGLTLTLSNTFKTPVNSSKATPKPSNPLANSLAFMDPNSCTAEAKIFKDFAKTTSEIAVLTENVFIAFEAKKLLKDFNKTTIETRPLVIPPTLISLRLFIAEVRTFIAEAIITKEVAVAIHCPDLNPLIKELRFKRFVFNIDMTIRIVTMPFAISPTLSLDICLIEETKRVMAAAIITKLAALTLPVNAVKASPTLLKALERF